MAAPASDDLMEADTYARNAWSSGGRDTRNIGGGDYVGQRTTGEQRREYIALGESKSMTGLTR
jgi:hypothetical protein